MQANSDDIVTNATATPSSDTAQETTITIEDITCAICHRVYLDPITTPCTHSFCRNCLLHSFEALRKQDCPLCRTILGMSVEIKKRENRDKRIEIELKYRKIEER